MSVEKKYGQFCPIALASEILTTRWTPIILHELLCGSTRFSELVSGIPKVSQSLLSSRLNDLAYYGLIEKRRTGKEFATYHLTEAGQALAPVLDMIGLWGRNYLMHHITEDEKDPALLFWNIRRALSKTRDIPLLQRDKPPYVISFEVSGVDPGQQRWWIVKRIEGADLCCKDPGHEIQLSVAASIDTLVSVWIGTKSLASALESGKIRLEGPHEDKRAFSSWFCLSPFANTKTRQRLSLANLTGQQALEASEWLA